MILPLDCAALFSQPSKYANEMQPQSSPLPCPSKLTGTWLDPHKTQQLQKPILIKFFPKNKRVGDSAVFYKVSIYQHLFNS